MTSNTDKQHVTKAVLYIRKINHLGIDQFGFSPLKITAKSLSVLIHASLILSLTKQSDLKLQNVTSKNTAISMFHRYPEKFNAAKCCKNKIFIMEYNQLKLTFTV